MAVNSADEPLDDTAQLRLLAHGMELQVQAIRQEVTSLTLEGNHDVITLPTQRDRARLWSLMSEGHFIFRPIPCKGHLVNPLLMALRNNRDDETDEENAVLPDTLLTLLLANCDPNELGHKGLCTYHFNFGALRGPTQTNRQCIPININTPSNPINLGVKLL